LFKAAQTPRLGVAFSLAQTYPGEFPLQAGYAIPKKRENIRQKTSGPGGSSNEFDDPASAEIRRLTSAATD